MIKSSDLGKSISGYLGKFFAWLPLHPNSITLVSIILAALAGFSWGSSLASQVQALVLFLFAFFFDAIDGAVARAKNLTSKQGAFLDGISDRLVEFFLVFALLKTSPELQFPLMLTLFFGTAMTSFVKAYAEHSQLLSHEEALKMPGLMERTERSLLLLAAAVLFMLKIQNVFLVIIYFTALMSVLTFLQRFFLAYTKPKQ
jgi:phosphatidylglycerophosphate synthase